LSSTVFIRGIYSQWYATVCGYHI